MSLWGKKKVVSFKQELDQVMEEPPLAQRVELLEIEVATLKNLLTETSKRVILLENILQKISNSNMYSKICTHEKIYEAYDKGVDVTEIAKKFNRGKGEIELILNLRNLK